MAVERKGITFAGKPVTLLGNEIKPGDKAPDFTVLDNQLNEFSSKQVNNKVRIISIVTSLDTGVCDTETRRFNREAASLGDKVEILTVSVDLPFAQRRWCGAAGIDKIKVLSDHRELSCGMAFGAVIKELRLLARSVFVIDAKNIVRYVEYVQEGSHEPDYDKALAAVKALI